MPGERELSRQLDISRPTLRLALERLRAEGWLKVTPGSQRWILPRGPRRVATQPQVVGVLTPLPLREIPPFALCWMDRLRELLARAGVKLEIHSGRRWYSRRPEKDLSALTQQSPAAAWLLFVTSERMQRWFADSGLPAALSGSCHPGIVLPSVDFDYRAICRHAVGQFLRRGHRRIALLMHGGETAGDRESAAGFTEAFGARGGASGAAIDRPARWNTGRHSPATSPSLSIQPAADGVIGGQVHAGRDGGQRIDAPGSAGAPGCGPDCSRQRLLSRILLPATGPLSCRSRRARPPAGANPYETRSR